MKREFLLSFVRLWFYQGIKAAFNNFPDCFVIVYLEINSPVNGLNKPFLPNFLFKGQNANATSVSLFRIGFLLQYLLNVNLDIWANPFCPV